MTSKKQILQKHKAIATGLFLAMVTVYIASVFFQREYPYLSFIGYIKAFSEAAMVGALADWFAVTALFNKPLGLPIPHTNLIENRKNDIGDNLGSFVVDNFLNAENIRPYIHRIEVSKYVGEWLMKEKNTQTLISEIEVRLLNIIEEADNEKVIQFITDKSSDLLEQIPLHTMASELVCYALQRKEHQRLLDYAFERIQTYVENNEGMIRERVKKESSSFIPAFIDNKLAQKITIGLANYFKEAQENQEHPIRLEIESKISQWADDIKTKPKWIEKSESIKQQLIRPEKIKGYATDFWGYIKSMLQEDLKKSTTESAFKSYLQKSIQKWVNQLYSDKETQEKLDHWLQKNAYRYILRNRQEVGNLISQTVGDWKGRELSEKLELEVGKDLQFIRINGTLVGGLMGLLIYAITHLLMS